MKELTTRDFLYASLLAALTGVLGYIVIPLPFSPVPVTGQTLGVMLAGCVLTTRQAAMSMITFLLLGAVGVPVFAGATAGLGILFGPRGGYLFGFLVGAIVISLIKRKFNSLFGLGIANIIGGIIIVYILGVLWLNYVTQMGLTEAVTIGALPFIPGDLFKAVVAAVTGMRINKQINSR